MPDNTHESDALGRVKAGLAEAISVLDAFGFHQSALHISLAIAAIEDTSEDPELPKS